MSERTAVEITVGDGPATRAEVADRVGALRDRWGTECAPPPLHEFVPSGPPALRRIVLVELVKADLDLRWSRGYLKQVEAYVGEFPELFGPDGVPCDLIVAEYEARRRHATAAPAEDYAARFPARAETIVRLLTGSSTVRPKRAASGTPAPLSAGQQLDDFDLLALVGEGAFAKVFLARQRSMQRMVALKVSADHGAEPQTLAQLDHPHVVRVYDQRVLPERGLRLLYMPYLPGGTLRDVIPLVKVTPVAERSGTILLQAVDAALARRGEVPPTDSAVRTRIAAMSWPEAVCWLGGRLAEALDYAHRMGVLHRDLKPANVLLGSDAAPRLADFNVSSCSKVDGAGPEAFFGGSLAYMSPEQLEAFNPAHDRDADSLDGRTDQYALAITLWELLTGNRPFPDSPVTGDWPRTLAALVAQREAGVAAEVVAQLPPDLPPGMLDTVWKALQPDADRRFATAGEFARQLDLCLKPNAQALLNVTPGWRQWVIRHATVSVLAVCLMVNGLTSLFSIEYNRAALIDPYPAVEGTFQLLQIVVNGTFFPICTAIMVRYVWPVDRALRRGFANTPGPADRHALRLRCVRFGHTSVFVSLWAWVVSGVIFPVTLHLSVHELPIEFHAHFFVSQFLCGLVAVSYPQFGVTFLVFRCLYPALVTNTSIPPDELAALRAVDRSQNLYLLVAASVPMLAVGLLAGFGAEKRGVLAVLSVVGIFGFVAASILVAAVRADRAALEEVKAG